MDKVLKVAAVFCVLILFISIILTFYGIVNFSIIDDRYVPFVLDNILCFFMFMFNMLFVFSATLWMLDKRIVKVLVFYTPILLISSFLFGEGFLTQAFLPFIYIMLYGKIGFKLRFLAMLKRHLILIIIIGIIQLGLSFVKLLSLNFTTYEINAIIGMQFSIDLYIVFIILMIGGVVYEKSKKEKNKDSMELVVFAEGESVPVDRECARKEKLDLTKLTPKNKIIFFFIATAFQFFQLAIVLCIGYLNNLFLETVTIFLVFIFTKSILKTCWHSDTLFWCSIATFASFYILTKITLPFSISLFLSIFLSCAFTYGLYLIGSREEKIEKAFDEIEKINAFSIGACSQDQLLKRCREVGLSKEDSGLAVMLFVDKINIAKESEKLGYCEQSLRNKKLRLKKRLCLEYIKK